MNPFIYLCIFIGVVGYGYAVLAWLDVRRLRRELYNLKVYVKQP